MFSAMDQALAMTINVLAKSFTQEEAESVFDRLPAVEQPEFLLGEWSGGYLNVDAGQGLNELLQGLNWAGKRFRSVEDVEPVLVENEVGEWVVDEQWGRAKLRKVDLGGLVSTAMVYDNQPIVDVFRKVTDDVVWGMMLSADPGYPPNYLFFLERVKDCDGNLSTR